jgi:hypothetical protein
MPGRPQGLKPVTCWRFSARLKLKPCPDENRVSEGLATSGKELYA